MIQIPSWLLVDVSSKFLKLSCNAVAWYYVQSLLKMPRTFFFLENNSHCTACHHIDLL